MINLLKIIVLNWNFVQSEIESQRQLAREEERPKIFQMAQKDILETMQDDISEKAEELSREKLQSLLTVVDERKVITFSSTQKAVFVGGVKIEEGHLISLKAEAEMLQKTDLWSILYETPKKLAEKAMFVDDGKLETQLLKGRAVLYTLATQKRIIDTLTSYAQKE